VSLPPHFISQFILHNKLERLKGKQKKIENPRPKKKKLEKNKVKEIILI
jgi:recombinational DNA repair protein RecR